MSQNSIHTILSLRQMYYDDAVMPGLTTEGLLLVEQIRGGQVPRDRVPGLVQRYLEKHGECFGSGRLSPVRLELFHDSIFLPPDSIARRLEQFIRDADNAFRHAERQDPHIARSAP